MSVDAERIEDVFLNLLSNAIRYTPIQGSVTVGLKEENNQAVVWLTDTGIGIPEEAKKNLFTKFFRADNAKRVQADGSGLGLFIAKRIVDAHGGTIGVQTEVGKGSTFTVSIPKKHNEN